MAEGRRRTILLCAPRDSLRIKPPLDMAIASAMAFGDIIGGDVGALDNGKAASGNAIEAGNEEDRVDMAGISSGEDREGILGTI